MRACGASDEDQSMWGIGNPASSPPWFRLIEVDRGRGYAPVGAQNSL